jgi:hypothetical protein
MLGAIQTGRIAVLARPPAYSIFAGWGSTAMCPITPLSPRTDMAAFERATCCAISSRPWSRAAWRKDLWAAKLLRSTRALSSPTPSAGGASPKSRTSIRRPAARSRNICRFSMTRPSAGRRDRAEGDLANRSCGPLHRFGQLRRRLCLV